MYEEASISSNMPNIKLNILCSDNDNDNDDEDEDGRLFRGSSNNPEFTTHHSITKSTEKSLRDELEKLNLPLDIINTADKIFQKMQTGTRRGQKRKQLIFYCVRSAYDSLGIVKDPKELADICEIDYSQITKASSMCSPVQTNYSSLIVVYSPIQYIPIVYDRIVDAIQTQHQFSEGALEQILEIAKEVTTIDENDEFENPLLDGKPQIAAAAIIAHYLEKYEKFELHRTMYKPLFKATYSTINKLKLQVEAIYNK